MVYKIAVFYEEVQMSDVTGADLFGNCSRKTIEMLTSAGVPLAPILHEQSIPMEFLYVSSTLEAPWSTPDIHIIPSHTYDTCPRDIDVLLVGGPVPTQKIPGSIKFFQDIFSGNGKDGVVVMTTCTGAMWLANSGVLEGKKVTTNRVCLEMARQMHPNVKWEDRRWVVEKFEAGNDGKGGELWTSGGAQCGVDMIGAFITERFPHPLAANSLMGLDVDPTVLGQDYHQTLGEMYAKLKPKEGLVN